MLFLDELTWVQRDDVWSIIPQLVLDKIAGFVKLSPNTVVVAAGNRPEDGSIVRLIFNPLLNRFKILNVEPPTLEDWSEWMDKMYGEKWDKRVLAFLMAFRNEGYFLMVPKTGEGLEQFPTPRSWTALALDLYNGLDSIEDIIGLVGSEVGRKFKAFLDLKVDFSDLLENPSKFSGLSLDTKYVVCLMLANWLSNKRNPIEKSFPLIDAMAAESREYIVFTGMCLNYNRRVEFYSKLFAYRREYGEALMNIRKAKQEIVG